MGLVWMLLISLMSGCDDTKFGEPIGGSTDSDSDAGSSSGYHPDGWANPTSHGLAAKYQEDDCVACHGGDLGGGDVGVSCDACHADGWRTDCTFCHGGEDNLTGAPPVDLDNQSSDLSFQAHSAHVSQTDIHRPFACVECHLTPTDVLSEGHFLVDDDTPRVAEVIFAMGLSSTATYQGSGSCSNLYCHGNGQGANGSVTHTASIGCGDCHAVEASGRSGWGQMSEPHEDHLREGLSCVECHSLTLSSTDTIGDFTRHLSGAVDVQLPYGMTRSDAGRCSGSCHGESHSNRAWQDD